MHVLRCQVHSLIETTDRVRAVSLRALEEDGLDLLYLIPLFQVVLSVDRVLSASAIVLFRVTRDRGHARLIRDRFVAARNTTLLESLTVDHSVRSRVAWSMARTLVKHIVCLSHLLGLEWALVRRPFYFPVGTIDLKTSDFLQVMVIVSQGCIVVGNAHSIRLFCHSTHAVVCRGSFVLYVSVLDLLFWKSSTRNRPTVSVKPKCWRAGPFLACQRELDASFLLIEGLVSAWIVRLYEDAVFKFLNSIICV